MEDTFKALKKLNLLTRWDQTKSQLFYPTIVQVFYPNSYLVNTLFNLDSKDGRYFSDVLVLKNGDKDTFENYGPIFSAIPWFPQRPINFNKFLPN